MSFAQQRTKKLAIFYSNNRRAMPLSNCLWLYLDRHQCFPIRYFYHLKNSTNQFSRWANNTTTEKNHDFSKWSISWYNIFNKYSYVAYRFWLWFSFQVIYRLISESISLCFQFLHTCLFSVHRHFAIWNRFDSLRLHLTWKEAVWFQTKRMIVFGRCQ